MSDLADINRKLDEMRDMATRTSQDVSWIKQGMVDGQKRMDSHDSHIGKLNDRVSRMQGSSSVFGSVAGAIFGGMIAYFTRAHT